MKLVALRQLHSSEYGDVKEGETFEVKDEQAGRQLIDQNLAKAGSGSSRSTRKAKGAQEQKRSQPMTTANTFSTTQPQNKAGAQPPKAPRAARKRGGGRRR